MVDLLTQVAMCWCSVTVTVSIFRFPLVCPLSLSPVPLSGSPYFSPLLTDCSYPELFWKHSILFTHVCVVPYHCTVPPSLGLVYIPTAEIPFCFYHLPIRWGPSFWEIPGQLSLGFGSKIEFLRKLLRASCYRVSEGLCWIRTVGCPSPKFHLCLIKLHTDYTGPLSLQKTHQNTY